MPDPVSFAESVTGGIAEQATVFLTELDESLAVSGLVLEAALRLHTAAADATEGDVVPDTTSLAPVAESLAAIATRSIGMLQSMVDAGAIEAPETILGLTAAPTALAIEAGNPDPDTNPGGQEDELDHEVVTRQRRVLLDVFGDAKEDEIDNLRYTDKVYFGHVLKALYQQISIGTRGLATQAERADQFADVLAGLSTEDIEAKYGQNMNAIRQGLAYAAKNVIPKTYPTDKLNELFDATLATCRSAAK